MRLSLTNVNQAQFSLKFKEFPKHFLNSNLSSRNYCYWSLNKFQVDGDLKKILKLYLQELV